MQGHIAPAVRASGLCCHCGRGLPYDTYYFWCLFCDLSVCAECPSSHPAVHQPYYKYLLNRTTPRGARPSQLLCTKCRQLSHCRLSCDDCEFNLCVNCVTTSRDLVASHPHGKMTVTKAPDDFGLGLYSVQCDSCRAGATLSHCGRCSNGIRKGGNFWTCVTCIVDYNAQIRFCEDCQAPGQREHDPTHRFASFLYRVNINKDARYNAVKCLDCKASVPFSGRELARHPHSRFQLIMGEAERDRRQFHSHRTCARKPVRDIATVSSEAHDILCGSCNQKFPMGSRVFMCPTCTMMACAACADFGGARSHSHIMIPVSLQWTIPPALLGQVRAASDVTGKSCAKCEKLIVPDSDCYIECNHCQEWDICLDCTKKSNIPVRHECHEAVDMTFFDPIRPGNDGLVAQVLATQKLRTAGVSSRVQPARQQSFSIQRKSSSTRSPSVSSIPPIVSVPQAAGIQRRPVISPHASQSAINQQTMQVPASLTLPMPQSVSPSIQPVIQPVANTGEIKRKIIHPAIVDVSKSVMDKSNTVSRAAYGKASSMVNDVDKEKIKNMGKSMGKKMARYAGAVTGQIIRQEIQNDTGITLPPLHLAQNPNQQVQALHAQMQAQQGQQQIQKLQAQLQIMQKMSQAQSQAMQQLQHQSVTHPAAVTTTTAQLTPSVQATAAPLVNNQTPSNMISGSSNILHPTTATSTSGVHSPSSGIIASVPPGEVHTANSSGMTFMAPSEILTVDGGMPAILNNSSLPPLPSNQTDIAPIPLCEQTPSAHSTDDNLDLSPAATIHSAAQSPAPTPVTEIPSPHSSVSHPVQSPDSLPLQPQQQSHNPGPQSSINNTNHQAANDNHEHPSTEEENQSETLQHDSGTTVPQNQHSSHHEASNSHMQGSNNLPDTSSSVPQYSDPQTQHVNSPEPHLGHSSGTTPNLSHLHESSTSQHDSANPQYQTTQAGPSSAATPSQHPNTNSQQNLQHNVPASAPTQHSPPTPNEQHSANNQHSPGAFQLQHQAGQLPTGNSALTGGEADEYYQTHPLNSPATGTSSTHNQNSSQQSPSPSQPQTAIPTTIPTTSIPTVNASSTQPNPPQNNHPLGGNGQATPQFSPPSHVPAQTPQPNMTMDQLNIQNQQIQALQQRIHAMNLQQQQQQAHQAQQSQQLQLLQQQQNQQGDGGSPIVDAGLSILNNLTQNLGNNNNNNSLNLSLNNNSQQQVQLGSGGSPIVDAGLSILNNLTQNLGNSSSNNAAFSYGSNSNIQQQLLLQEQQQLNFLNNLQSQNQLNNQMQTNMELESLNAELAALNNMQSMGSFNNNATGFGDVNINMDVVVDQSFDTQTNAGGFSVTDSSSFYVADTSF